MIFFKPVRLTSFFHTREIVSGCKGVPSIWLNIRSSLVRGFALSASMVGRIICYLKKRGALREPVFNYVSAGKRQRVLPYAIRKPKDYEARQIGDIIQLDTLDLRPLPGVALKHFTAHDVISKWDVVGVYHRAQPLPQRSSLMFCQNGCRLR